MEDFRVIFVLPTGERTLNLLEKTEVEFPYRRFWLTDEAKLTKILGEIFKTPRDYEKVVYSLLSTLPTNSLKN